MPPLGASTATRRAMLFLLLAQAFSLLLELNAPRISRWEKLTVVVLARELTGLTASAHRRLSQVVLLFKPDTPLQWHRELVRRKWTFKKKVPLGRPPIAPEVEHLLRRLARENPTWGYGKLEGELGKLGYDIGRSTIRHVLKRRRAPVVATCLIQLNFTDG